MERRKIEVGSDVYLTRIREDLKRLSDFAISRHLDTRLLTTVRWQKYFSQLLNCSDDEIPLEISVAEWNTYVKEIEKEMNNRITKRGMPYALRT